MTAPRRDTVRAVRRLAELSRGRFDVRELAGRRRVEAREELARLLDLDLWRPEVLDLGIGFERALGVDPALGLEARGATFRAACRRLLVTAGAL